MLYKIQMTLYSNPTEPGYWNKNIKANLKNGFLAIYRKSTKFTWGFLHNNQASDETE